jgi:hypothetical protein
MRKQGRNRIKSRAALNLVIGWGRMSSGNPIRIRMSEITISSFDGFKPHETQICSEVFKLNFSDLQKFIVKKPWSPFLFKNVTNHQTAKGRIVSGMYRSKKTSIGSNVFALDFDDGMTLSEVQAVCDGEGLKYILAPTRSHQKEKNGKPACDRFRLILFPDRMISSDSEYLQVWGHFEKLFGRTFDESCKDEARFYFPSISIYHFKEEGTYFSVDKILENGKECVFEDYDKVQKGRLFKSTTDFIESGKIEKSWHHTFFKAASDLRDQDYSMEEAKLSLTKASKTYKGFLDENDLYQLRDVYERQSKYHFRESSDKFSGKESGPTEERFTEWMMPDEAAYHGPIGDLVKSIEPLTEADPIGIQIMLLAMVGNVVGRKPYYQVEGTRHHCNLFAVQIAPTSRGRKGTSEGRALSVLKILDKDWCSKNIQSGLSTGEGLINHIRDESKVVRKDNKGKVKEEIIPGVNDKRLYMKESEFASTLVALKRDTNNLSAILRSAWDGENLGTMTKGQPQRATDPHLSIMAQITQSELQKLMMDKEVMNGFANRFLHFRSRRTKVLPFGGGDLNLEPHIKALQGVLEFGKQERRFVFAESAREIWAKEYVRLTRDEVGIYGAVIARAEAQVVRLAMIYAICSRSEKIEDAHLRSALAIWNYCDWSCKSLFYGLGKKSEADRLKDFILSNGERKSRTQIRDFFGKNKSSEQIEKILKELEATGAVRRFYVQESSRPTEYWSGTDLKTMNGNSQ